MKIPSRSLLTALDECEFERYAPGDSSGQYESYIRIGNNRNHGNRKCNQYGTQEAQEANPQRIFLRHGLLAIMLGLQPLWPRAITKQNADTEYQKGNYQQAISDYEELFEERGICCRIYYNLGNAYYRTDNITKAVLNYERAHLYRPGDEDINFNLQFASSKTIDKITPVSEMFFVTWYKALVNYTECRQLGEDWHLLHHHGVDTRAGLSLRTSAS